jgi:magnesium transporter
VGRKAMRRQRSSVGPRTRGAALTPGALTHSPTHPRAPHWLRLLPTVPRAAQASGLVISAVSSRDVARTDVWRVLRKEVFVGALIALALSLAAALMGYLRATGDAKGNIALVLATSMAVVAVISNVLGVVFPFAALSVNIDPAVSSSALTTTVIDLLGIALYFSIAYAVLGG